MPTLQSIPVISTTLITELKLALGAGDMVACLALTTALGRSADFLKPHLIRGRQGNREERACGVALVQQQQRAYALSIAGTAWCERARSLQSDVRPICQRPLCTCAHTKRVRQELVHQTKLTQHTSCPCAKARRSRSIACPYRNCGPYTLYMTLNLSHKSTQQQPPTKQNTNNNGCARDCLTSMS